MPFITQGKTNLKYILIVVILAAIVGGGILGYYYLWIKDLETRLAVVELKIPEKISDETTGWKTFRGEITSWQTSDNYKFEFQAPQEFAEIIPHPGIKPEDYKYYYGAKGLGISLFVGLMEGPSLLSSLFFRANQVPLCSNPLVLNEKYYSSEAVFETCDVVQIDGRDSLFLMHAELLGFEATTCRPQAAVYIIHNLDNNTSILFTVELEVLKKITDLWPEIPPNYSFLDDGGMWFCPPDIDHSKVKEGFTANIKNIRNAENLSEGDTEKLKTVYKILSTFKFLD